MGEKRKPTPTPKKQEPQGQLTPRGFAEVKRVITERGKVLQEFLPLRRSRPTRHTRRGK